MKYKVGDKLLLHSQNGRDYTIDIVNVNNCRPTGEQYAVDVFDDEGNSDDDVWFVGKDFLDSCKPLQEGE